MDARGTMSQSLRMLMLVTDVGLLGYWALTALAVTGYIGLPSEWLFSDYHNPVIVVWNWSFLPLDFAVSITGLTSVQLAARNDERWTHYAVISLSLTACAGLMAVSFWAIRLEFNPVWWIFNLYLLFWPLPFLCGNILARARGDQARMVERRAATFTEAPVMETPPTDTRRALAGYQDQTSVAYSHGQTPPWPGPRSHSGSRQGGS
jgi:hypothetical protein